MSPRALAPLPAAPGRMGPGPLPAPLVDAIDLVLRRRIEGLLPGEHPVAGVGAGTELAQVRAYQPGDDVRHLDPNATARTGEPHVRVHVPERGLTTWLLLDTSASMAFGTADRLKADVAEGVALVLGRIATRRGGRLGVATFGAGAPRTLPPRQGRGGLMGLLAALRRGAPADGDARAPRESAAEDGLARALVRTGRLARVRGLVVVVSDFRGPRDWRRALLALRARHGVLAVEIRDPREQALPDVGHLWLVDPETGRQLRVDTGRRALRERFAQAAEAERVEVAAALRRAGSEHVVLSTQGPWLRDLAGGLRRGAR